MRTITLLLALAGLTAALSAGAEKKLPKGLLFHAAFDGGSTDARVARGDAKLYSAASYKQQAEAVAGLAAAPQVALDGKEGRGGSGGALRFASKNNNAVFFKAAGNVPFQGGTNWTGTIAFWLRLDPDKDLAPGFCDPIQVTDKAYNDSAIWVDFTKDDTPRHFRLGVFGALKSWNPSNLEPDKNPAFNSRLVVVKQPPFTRDKWTLVAITHERLGSGKGRATLYVDGTAAGSAEGIAEPFVWDEARGAIRLGVAYVGLMDDVMIFDRALKAGEIARLAK